MEKFGDSYLQLSGLRVKTVTFHKQTEAHNDDVFIILCSII